MQSRKIIYRLLGLCLTAGLLPTANASFIIEIDTDGLDDGVLTYNTNFSFGGDTTTASQSAATSALGMTGGDSIFGGDGVNLPDTYVYTYDLDVDGDNLALTAGAALNGSGNTASGEVAKFNAELFKKPCQNRVVPVIHHDEAGAESIEISPITPAARSRAVQVATTCTQRGRSRPMSVADLRRSC